MSYRTSKIYRSISSGLTMAAVNTAIDNKLAHQNEVIGMAVTDEDTPIVIDQSVIFRMPFNLAITQVRANLKSPQTGGDLFTVNIKQNGTSIFSVPLTLDNNEKTSLTASNPYVLSTLSLLNDAEIEVVVTMVGTGDPTGLKIWIIGNRA